MTKMSIVSLSLILLLSLKCTLGYYVVVDAHTDECFFEKLTSGTKLLLTFEVIEGGFLDIDVKVIIIDFSLINVRSYCYLKFRLVDRIKRKSTGVTENQVAKQHSLLIWMVSTYQPDIDLSILKIFRYIHAMFQQ